MTIQIAIEAHSLDDEFEAISAEAGVKIIDRTQEPWCVIFEGEREKLIKLVAEHWLNDDGVMSIDEAERIVDSHTLKQPFVTKHEYAFDVTLQGVVRVVATDELKARAALTLIVDGMAPDGNWISGFNDVAAVKVTEVSIAADTPATIFQIDGKDI